MYSVDLFSFEDEILNHVIESMKSNPKYQIFVSSTFADLETERWAVQKAILDLDHIPAGMESFPAANIDQMTYIRRLIDQCDYYLLIIAGRYGSVDEKGTSFTELEFDYAVSTGKPVLVFSHKTPDTLPRNKCDIGEEALARLVKFRERASKHRLVKFWTSEGELVKQVCTALSNAFKTEPQTGWVRGDTLAGSEGQLKIAHKAELARVSAGFEKDRSGLEALITRNAAQSEERRNHRDQLSLELDVATQKLGEATSRIRELEAEVLEAKQRDVSASILALRGEIGEASNSVDRFDIPVAKGRPLLPPPSHSASWYAKKLGEAAGEVSVSFPSTNSSQAVVNALGEKYFRQYDLEWQARLFEGCDRRTREIRSHVSRRDHKAAFDELGKTIDALAIFACGNFGLISGRHATASDAIEGLRSKGLADDNKGKHAKFSSVRSKILLGLQITDEERDAGLQAGLDVISGLKKMWNVATEIVKLDVALFGAPSVKSPWGDKVRGIILQQHHGAGPSTIKIAIIDEAAGELKVGDFVTWEFGRNKGTSKGFYRLAEDQPFEVAFEGGDFFSGRALRL